MKRIINLIALVILIAGLFILVDPFIRQFQRATNTSNAIEEFKALAQSAQPVKDGSATTEVDDAPSDVTSDRAENSERTSDASVSDEYTEANVSEAASDGTKQNTGTDNYSLLYSSMQEYNKEIFESKQSDLRDAFSYTTSSINFNDFGFPSDCVGYITVEKMGVELPLYLGSSSSNMSKGATIMDHTSMPTGGNNTNCVIAAHRMAGFFGDIELLETGDIIKLTNLWDELYYKVVKIIIIDPYDTDKIKIFPGRDMITLLTCHPYWSNRTRYIVYCERTDKPVVTHEENNSVKEKTQNSTADKNEVSQSAASSPEPDKKPEPSYEETHTGIILPEGDEELSYSQSTIVTERIVRIAGAIIALVLMIVCLVNLFRPAGKNKQ